MYRIQRNHENGTAEAGGQATASAEELLEQAKPFTENGQGAGDILDTAKGFDEGAAEGEPAKKAVITEEVKESADAEKPVTEKEGEAAAIATGEEATEVTELTLSEASEQAPASTEEEIEWSDVAKELGFENAENIKDIDTLKATYKANLEKASSTPANIKAEYGEEGVRLFQALKETSIEEIVAPLAPFDQAMALPDTEKLKIYYQGKGLTEAQIAAKIERLTDADEVGEVVAEINQTIQNNRATRFNEIVATAAQKASLREQQSAAAQQALNANTADLLARREDYEGIKINAQAKKTLDQRIKSGYYDKMLSNPETRMKAILDMEFGAIAKKETKHALKSEGKAEVLDKLPGIESAKVSTRTTGMSKAAAPAVSDEPFANWSKLSSEKIEIGATVRE